MKSQRSKYLNNGYKEIYNKNLIYNYQFYYSNKSIDNNSIISLLFEKDKPKFISINNFVLDTESYKDIIGNLPPVNEGNSDNDNINANDYKDIIDNIEDDITDAASVKIVFSII